MENNMTLHAPQLIYLALMLISLGIAMSRHGEPKSGNHNLLVDIIATALGFALVYWGGFFG
jgi:hypothetical protein